MKIVIQRVNHSSVKVENQTVGSIQQGLMLLVGFGQEDQGENFQKIVSKIVNMRLFPDESGRFDKSVLEIDGQILVVPQFTLYSDTRKGRRPDFFSAQKPDIATKQFDKLVEEFRKKLPGKIETGVFGAHMQVALENDGPVTILLEHNCTT